MNRWLITYSYRLHKRHRDDAAIFMGVDKGTKTEIIDVHPVQWLSLRQHEWTALENNKFAGEAMTNIVVSLAIEERFI